MATTKFLIAAVLATATIASPLDSRAACSETPDRVCYGVKGGESQNLDLDDVQYVADYLRYISDQNQGDAKFWKMPKAADCAEWGLPVDDAGTVLALAKHTNPSISSSILYEDIAAAIDGGLNASDEGKKEILGCGKNGGQIGVKANLTNPLYHTQEYKNSTARPEGIIVKLVKAPSS